MPVDFWKIIKYFTIAAVLTVAVASCDRETSAPATPRVAVLPFVSPGAPDLGVVLAEAIIARLSSVTTVDVVSFSSVSSIDAATVAVAQLRESLGVDAVLGGHVRRNGDDMAWSCLLVSAVDEHEQWAQEFNFTLAELVEVEGRVCVGVLTALAPPLDDGDRRRVEWQPTSDGVAYDTYLHGRAQYHRRGAATNDGASQLYKQALTMDREFVLARAALADAYTRRTNLFGFGPEWLDSAVTNAELAIAQDGQVAQAYKALGFALAVRGRTEAALDASLRAVELSPNFAPAIANVANLSLTLGRFDLAAAWFQRATILRPRDARIHASLGQAYFALGRRDDAATVFAAALAAQPGLNYALAGLGYLALAEDDTAQASRRAREILEKDADDFFGLHLAGDAALGDGDYDSAETHFRRLRGISLARSPYSCRTAVSGLALAAFKGGRQPEGLNLMDQVFHADAKMIATDNTSFYPFYEMASVTAARGDTADALLWLRQAVDSGWPFYALGRVDPFFELLWSDAEFINMMAEVELRAASTTVVGDDP